MNAAGPWIEGLPPKIDQMHYLAEIKGDEEIPNSIRVIWWEEFGRCWERWGFIVVGDDDILRYAEIHIGDDDGKRKD